MMTQKNSTEVLFIKSAVLIEADLTKRER